MWQARIQHDGHRENLGSFEEDKEEDAARTFDAASRRLRGAQAHGGGSLGRQWCLNFPTDEEITSAAQTCAANKDKEDKKEEERQAEKEDQRAAAARKLVGARTSRFLGVAWTKRTGKWHARIQARIETEKGIDAINLVAVAPQRTMQRFTHGIQE